MRSRSNALLLSFAAAALVVAALSSQAAQAPPAGGTVSPAVELAVGHEPTSEEIDEALKKVKADPDFAAERKVKSLRWVDDKQERKANPGWLKWLPRPGAWMVTFKRVLSIPLFATVVWLGWVLALQSGLLAASSDWERFSSQTLRKYEAQGRAVFVDYTAAWCVTCQVNKRLVLNTEEVREAFARKNVALVRADWTRRDPDITRALAALGRTGVPVYVLYRPGKNPVLLPEVLQQQTGLEALASLDGEVALKTN